MIRPFKGKDVIPYYPTVLDIETAPNGDVIAVGFAYEDTNGNRTYSAHSNFDEWFDSYHALLRNANGNKTRIDILTRVYAHNGANFDYLSLYEWLTARTILTDGQYYLADSTGIGFDATLYDQWELRLLDSYRMLPASLDKLSHTFGVENVKQEVPEECASDYERFKREYPDLFWIYLHHDVLGLQEVLYKFWGMMVDMFGNVGHLPMTLPSLVMRVFSKQLDEDIYTPSNDELKTFERIAYKGGLTLCIKTGIYDWVKVYDVNSMYPAAMVRETYPAHYAGYWTHLFEPGSIGLWEASYEQPKEPYPPFLFDSEKGAAYKGKGIFSTKELEYLVSIGGTYSINKGYVYVRTKPLFKGFISLLYTKRKQAVLEGDEGLAFTLKIMMNSLYGKFAQKEVGNKVEFCPAVKIRERVLAGERLTLLGNFVVTQETRVVHHAFVSIAAMITANARIHLHTLMRDHIDTYGIESVVYCDTDSIHCTRGIMNESPELGEVKLENEGQAAYAGRKLYSFNGGKTKSKGIGRKLVANPTPPKRVKKGDKIATPKTVLSFTEMCQLAENPNELLQYTFTTAPSVKEVLGEKAKAAQWKTRTRRIRNTGGIRDENT